MSESVVIAGAGPVGLLLAYELGLAGVEAVVVDDNPQPRADAPGVALNSAVVELLSQRPLMDLLEDDGFGFPQAHFANLWLDPARLTDPHPFTFTAVQSTVERRLAEAATKLGARIRRGAPVVGFDGDEVHLGDGARLPYRYLVGCDGADSTVRRLAGIGFPGADHPFDGITGDIEIAPGDPLAELVGAGFHPGGLFTLAPTGPEILALADPDEPPDGPVVLRVIAGAFGADPPDPQAPPTVEELHALAVRVLGRPVTFGPVRWLARWRHRSRQAAEYRRGNVFLAGDAAHVQFPLGGLALSTGLEDAVNLGWKLAAAVTGRAPAGLLDTYHAERHPVGARVLLATEAQTHLMHPSSRIGPLRQILTELIGIAGVNEYFVRLAGGLDSRYPVFGDDPHPLLGRRLPDYRVRTPTGPTGVAALLHEGRGLLLHIGDGPAPDISGWSDRVGTITVSAAEAFQAASVLLVRPDGRIAFAAADAVGLDDALRTWFGPAV
ncbi:FAD-dependent monooxygenase [Dactylosporangium sp. NPDC051541]|uniref:FAD-dependent monooxygenase n=1 Tax=Dactylosporangium sp. NPDC051541 TaxID=3363977 RepID=UPI00379FF3D9